MDFSTDWVREIQTLFAEKLFVEVESPDTDLFQQGILDSMSLVELLLQLEQTYGFTVSIMDLDTEDIRTIRKIAELVSAREAAPALVKVR
jgi:D-alanine--poly(phosphoribitol) ligase subunit 2